MMIRLRRLALVLSPLLMNTGVALASGPEEWAAFRQDVQEKCLLATLPYAQTLEPVGQLVDLYGSESYGFSLIQMQDKETKQLSLIACAYDKVNMTEEVSAPFTGE